jgi:exonuclease-1
MYCFHQVLKKIPTILNLNVTITPDYIQGFYRADNTFLYQLVYDPIKRKQVPLNPYPEGINRDELQYAGTYPCINKCLIVKCCITII